METDMGTPGVGMGRQTDADSPMSFPTNPGKGEYIWTFTGQKFFFSDPGPNIRLDDIAHALSLICRWTGHVKKFYSVAEHCVRCSLYPAMTLTEYERAKDHNQPLRNPAHALRKLLHDAPEAYITDLNKPVKNLVGGVYEALDAKITIAIWKKYGLSSMNENESKAVKEADLALAMTEARDLLNQTSVAHYEGAKALKEIIQPWEPATAERMFRERFMELM